MWLKKYHGESVESVTECLLVRNVMPTTADQTNKARNSINAKNVKKIMFYKRRRPENHMCGEVHCLNCEDFVDPNTQKFYMKPIVIEENEDQEEQEQQKKKKKTRRKRMIKGMINDEVEEDGEEEEDKNIFSLT